MKLRTMLLVSALIPGVASLGACSAATSTTTNQVTTVTVNVADLNAWGNAIVNAAKLVSTLPGIVGTPAGTTIAGIATIAGTDLAAVAAAAGASQTFTFNNGSVPAAINSLLGDGQTLLTDAQGAIGNVSSTATQNAQTYIAALSTIVALFQATVTTLPPAAAMADAKMTPAQALAVLGVK